MGRDEDERSLSTKIAAAGQPEPPRQNSWALGMQTSTAEDDCSSVSSTSYVDLDGTLGDMVNVDSDAESDPPIASRRRRPWDSDDGSSQPSPRGVQSAPFLPSVFPRSAVKRAKSNAEEK